MRGSHDLFSETIESWLITPGSCTCTENPIFFWPPRDTENTDCFSDLPHRLSPKGTGCSNVVGGEDKYTGDEH